MSAPFELGPDATYRDVVDGWRAVRAAGLARVREVACVGAARTLLCVEIGEAQERTVTLSAGVHGDEPAGVAALFTLARRSLLPDGFAYRLWPCLNPTGFDARARCSADDVDVNRTFGRGGSSPESKAVIMSNRDRKFALAIDLHEDDECSEPYAYAYGGAETLLDARVRVLTPDPAAEAEAIGGLSYTLLLIRNAARAAVTLETPAGRPFEERVAWHVDTVRAILARLSNGASSGDAARA